MKYAIIFLHVVLLALIGCICFRRLRIFVRYTAVVLNLIMLVILLLTYVPLMIKEKSDFIMDDIMLSYLIIFLGMSLSVTIFPPVKRHTIRQYVRYLVIIMNVPCIAFVGWIMLKGINEGTFDLTSIDVLGVTFMLTFFLMNFSGLLFPGEISYTSPYSYLHNKKNTNGTPDIISSSNGKTEIDFHDCPHCGVEDMLLMSDNRCPNCKQKL